MRTLSRNVLLGLGFWAIMPMFLAFSQQECRADQTPQVILNKGDQGENKKYTNSDIDLFIKSFNNDFQVSKLK